MLISNRISGVFLTIALGVFISRSEAAIITWQGTTGTTLVDAATDIDETGDYVDALYATTGGVDLLVGADTVFHGQTVTLNTGISFAANTANISIATNGPGGAGNNLTASPGNFPAGVIADTNYNAILLRLDYGSNNVSTQFGTITFSGLQIGHDYQTQIWSIQPDNIFYVTSYTSGPNTIALNLNPGQYALGTFTADATSQSLTFQNTSGNLYSAVNAIALRDVTVPEPGSLTLMGLSLFGLTSVVRRRRQA